MKKTHIISGSSHPELAELVSQHLNISLTETRLSHFSNKECEIEIASSVRSHHVYIIQSGGASNVNDNLMELLILINACKTASASKITAVIPYFMYSKQCRKKSRSSITAKLIANMLSVAGVHHIITMDLHASQMTGFFNVPIDNLLSEAKIATWIRENITDYHNGAVVSKKASGAKLVTSLASRLNLDFAILHNAASIPSSSSFVDVKTLLELTDSHLDQPIFDPNLSEPISDDHFNYGLTLVGNVSGKVVFLLDDIIDEAEPFILASKYLVQSCQAERVVVIAYHGILSGNSLSLIEACPEIAQLITTNSVVQECRDVRYSKLCVVDISFLIAEAIRRTHYGESFSFLIQ